MTPYLKAAKESIYFHSPAEHNLGSVHLMKLQDL